MRRRTLFFSSFYHPTTSSRTVLKESKFEHATKSKIWSNIHDVCVKFFIRYAKNFLPPTHLRFLFCCFFFFCFFDFNTINKIDIFLITREIHELSFSVFYFGRFIYKPQTKTRVAPAIFLNKPRTTQITNGQAAFVRVLVVAPSPQNAWRIFGRIL